MKLAVVGGGSTYTPEVIDGLVRFREQMPVDDLYLHDTNEERLAVVAGLARRMLQRAGHPANLIPTTSLEEATEGADKKGLPAVSRDAESAERGGRRGRSRRARGAGARGRRAAPATPRSG